MSAQNKAVVRRFHSEIVNTGDFTRIADFVAPDCVETDGLVPASMLLPFHAAGALRPA